MGERVALELTVDGVLVAIRKRIDRAIPLIVRALVLNQEVEAAFRFFRPTGGGTPEHFALEDVSFAFSHPLAVRGWGDRGRGRRELITSRAKL